MELGNVFISDDIITFITFVILITAIFIIIKLENSSLKKDKLKSEERVKNARSKFEINQSNFETVEEIDIAALYVDKKFSSDNSHDFLNKENSELVYNNLRYIDYTIKNIELYMIFGFLVTSEEINHKLIFIYQNKITQFPCYCDLDDDVYAKDTINIRIYYRNSEDMKFLKLDKLLFFFQSEYNYCFKIVFSLNNNTFSESIDIPREEFVKLMKTNEHN